MLPPRTKEATVSRTGANSGRILCGSGINNQGLRLQISHGQTKGNHGPIEGRFVIIDVGDNMHSKSLEKLLHRATNAEEVLGIIRLLHPACVNVVNASILLLEPTERSDTANVIHPG